MIVCLGRPFVAWAGDWSVSIEDDNPVYKYELYAGGDATIRARSIYTGVTFALFGDVRENGWRIRSAAGYGTYGYTSPRWNGSSRVPLSFQGMQSYTDVLVGYQHQFGPWIVKGFIGGAHERHIITPFDDENAVQGARLTFKAALETWCSIGDWAFLQSEINWSEAFANHGARLRAGYRLNPAWSIGLEAADVGNLNYEAGRFGSFARFEWTTGEVSIAGGVSGDQSGDIGAYGSVAFMLRF